MNEVERLQRRLEREKQARKSAELIAETKTRENYEANLRLQRERDNKLMNMQALSAANGRVDRYVTLS